MSVGMWARSALKPAGGGGKTPKATFEPKTSPPPASGGKTLARSALKPAGGGGGGWVERFGAK
jgi:hypothetical protein